MPMARLKLAPLTSFKTLTLLVDGKLTRSNKPLINLTKELVTLMTDIAYRNSDLSVRLPS